MVGALIYQQMQAHHICSSCLVDSDFVQQLFTSSTLIKTGLLADILLSLSISVRVTIIQYYVPYDVQTILQ